MPFVNSFGPSIGAYSSGTQPIHLCISPINYGNLFKELIICITSMSLMDRISRTWMAPISWIEYSGRNQPTCWGKEVPAISTMCWHANVHFQSQASMLMPNSRVSAVPLRLDHCQQLQHHDQFWQQQQQWQHQHPLCRINFIITNNISSSRWGSW
jgi:hypothetical protein